MKADQLLKHFDRISEAPDAVARLRRFVLDLAVRGKLVEQDPGDEPAGELLQRISQEKAGLFKAGILKKPISYSPTPDTALGYAAPDRWLFARLGEVALRIHYGYTASAKPKIRDFRLLRITDIQKNRVNWDTVPGCEISTEKADQYLLSKGDILIARTGGTIGKSFLVERCPVRAVFASYLIRLQLSSELFDRYIKVFLESSDYWEQLQGGARGAGQPNVNGKTLGKMVLPIPPLAEQHRIVAKVDELMAVCDELEQAQTTRENRRDRLVAATLHRLNNPDTEPESGPTFKQAAGFYLNHLPRLSTRPEHIQQLRQTILNLAVRGELVPQDSGDEGAAALIAQIKQERGQLGKAWTKALSGRPADGTLGYDLPASWGLVRLGFATNVVMGQSPPGSTYNKVGEGVPLINGPVEFTEGPFGLTALNQYTSAPTKMCRKGDLLLCVRGSTTGRTNVAAFDACIGRGVAALQSVYQDQFIRYFVWSWRYQIIEMGRGIAFPSVSKKQIENLPVPIPPLAEQHRIVAKVDELMSTVDQFESAVNRAEILRQGAVESALADALQ